MINKFEGDHNFDYDLFREIIERFQIPFSEIKLTELALIKTIDLPVLSSLSVTDFTQQFVSHIDIETGSIAENYIQFMDNLSLFGLMIDHYSYNTSINCLIASLVYFTARQDILMMERIRHVFKLVVDANSKEALRLDAHKLFVLRGLKELGTKEEDIEMLKQRIDVEILQI